MPARKRKSESPCATRPYMPGYGVPKGRKGILPWSWAEQRLKKSHNYWITTVRPDGSPHTMVIWGLWIDGAFYFSTGQESRKAKNLACNPKCIVCTENSSEAVVVEGEARRVHDSPDLKFFASMRRSTTGTCRRCRRSLFTRCARGWLSGSTRRSSRMQPHAGISR